MMTITTIANLGTYDLSRIVVGNLKTFFLVWFPEFMYYVLPALGTSSYFLTIEI
jgi:hypothetical protein